MDINERVGGMCTELCHPDSCGSLQCHPQRVPCSTKKKRKEKPIEFSKPHPQIPEKLILKTSSVGMRRHAPALPSPGDEAVLFEGLSSARNACELQTLLRTARGVWRGGLVLDRLRRRLSRGARRRSSHRAT